jgi:glycosyltransferase involved in cell wall biosynthesis
MSPTISVVVPSYNDAVMLERCLAALARQSRKADEIIVVDNGSSDATVDVAIAAGARVVTELRRGIPQATSAGFDAARGEILCRLDADSIPPRDWIARVERAFATEEHLDALSGPGRFYGASAVTHWVAETLYIGAYSTLIGFLLGHDVLFGSNLALRQSAWHRLRLSIHRDLRWVHDDLDLAINLEPGMGVRYDRTLQVGVSARPFDTWEGLKHRVSMAFDTFAINHREHSLLDRRRAWSAVTRPEHSGFRLARR